MEQAATSRKMTNHIKEQYTGSVAQKYEDKRQSEDKWSNEQETILTILEQISDADDEHLSILDVPVGTGRFFPFYKEFGFRATGADISNDMLIEAADKAGEIGFSVELKNDSIEQLSFDDGVFDNVLCIRILNWVDFNTLAKIFSELSRVSARNMIVGIRVSEREQRGLIGSAADLVSYWGIVGYRAVKAKLRPARLKIHRETRVFRLFERYDLTVQARVLVDRAPRHSSYYIYHLTQRNSD